MRRRRRRTIRLLATGLPVALSALASLAASPAAAAVTCPNPVPVVDENNCRGGGTTAWRVSALSDEIGGFTTRTSVNRGENVVLKVGRQSPPNPPTTVDIRVYRMGYYGGTGGRLVNSADGVSVENNLNCGAPDGTTGLVSCASWSPTYTIPAAALPASGVFLVRLRAPDTGAENYAVFTVRDDDRVPQAQMLYQLPIATYQAYNWFGGKSNYDFNSTGATTVSGSRRAVKLSFDRPFKYLNSQNDFLLKADYPLIYWLERQGYDVSYTDSVAVHANPAELRDHGTLVVSGHDEYWSGEELQGYKTARDAGVDVASFSANTAFWKVRFEDGGRTLVSYKTVEGTGRDGSGAVGQNDWGPDGVTGTADDALGLDQRAGTADDNPQNATTTFRDNGAPPGDPNAPPQGRVGPNTPENALFGVMYLGANSSWSYELSVPAGNIAGEYAADRIWRRSGLSTSFDTSFSDSKLVGWEWDAIPTSPQYLAQQPSGIKRLSLSETQPSPGPVEYLQDEGRIYNDQPPPGAPSAVSAVKYRAASGAQVFAAATNQWSWGLGPHFIDRQGYDRYDTPPVDASDFRIQQATYNILADTGVQPDTPSGISVDGGANQAPQAVFSASPNPPLLADDVTFDGSGSGDFDGVVVRYQWDLDGNGSFETDSGASPQTAHSYAASGPVTVSLRVTDNAGATGTTARTIVVGGANQAPTASFSLTPNPASRDENVTFDGSASADAEGPVTRYEWDLDGNGTFETDTGSSATTERSYATAGSRTIRLRVSDDRGLTATVSHTLVVLDNERPSASFTATPNPVFVTQTVTLDASGSTDPEDAIVKYEWDLDGNGTYETDTGANEQTTRSYPTAGTQVVGLRVTDDKGAIDTTTRLLTVRNPNQPPSAAFSATPAPALVDERVSFDATPSSDPDGAIARFEWDLDGNGSFETDTGDTARASRAYGAAGQRTVRLRVTDADGAMTSTERTFTVTDLGSPPYPQAVQSASTLAHYWRMEESTGGTATDSRGTRAITWAGAPGLGVGGALREGGNGTRFDGVNDAGSVPLDLGDTQQLTVEFWLKWTSFANDDRLALEFTPNFNAIRGGFIVDPNDSAGRFAVGIGNGATRNNVFFDRPSAGSWHHYALVFDTAALAADQIVPFVDGFRVPFTKAQSGTGAGAFANASLNVMSRAGTALFGRGDMDELAVYRGKLDDLTIRHHFVRGSANQLPRAAFTAHPDPAVVGENVRFDSAGSTDSDGTIVGYEWDLDGDGVFETDTGSSKIANGDYSVAGTVNPGLRVTDNDGGTHIVRRSLVVKAANEPPTAALGATPNPAFRGEEIVFDAAGSSDPEGDIAKYEWDLDGNGSFETDGASNPRTTRAYTTAGPVTARVRVTDNRGTTATASIGLVIQPNDRPTASFSFAPSLPTTGDDVSFNASASSDPEGPIAKYEWDLDGNGSFETDTGQTAQATKAFATAGDVTVKLRVTDGGGATHVAGKTFTVNARPVAAFTASPDPALVGETATLDGAGSSDEDGSITKYEWDLNGDGTYETDTGTTARASRPATTGGDTTVGLRVTDNRDARGTATKTIRTEDFGSVLYGEAVLATPALKHFWRLGEASGTLLADARGLSDATLVGGGTLGVPGGPAVDPNTAVRFDGVDDSASAAVDLSSSDKVTIEFWLRWDQFTNDDRLALEFTPNFNNVPRGFIIDPNDSDGRFAVGIGRGIVRNNVFFNRPTANAWHHYVFVLDTSASGDEAISPYVDGVAVPYTKSKSGAGGGAFASSTLYFMSRGGTSLRGRGDLDEFAIYTDRLSPVRIRDHYRRGKPQ